MTIAEIASASLVVFLVGLVCGFVIKKAVSIFSNFSKD